MPISTALRPEKTRTVSHHQSSSLCILSALPLHILLLAAIFHLPGTPARGTLQVSSATDDTCHVREATNTAYLGTVELHAPASDELPLCRCSVGPGRLNQEHIRPRWPSRCAAISLQYHFSIALFAFIHGYLLISFQHLTLKAYRCWV